MKSIIKNFVAKMVAGRSDDGIMITLSDPRKVDFQAAMLEDLLMRNGIDPRAITSEAQLKNILNQIEAMTKQSTTSGIRNAESAKIFEMTTGKEIPKGSKIMGGEAVETEAEIAARLEKDNKDSIQKILNRKNREDVYGIEDYNTTNMSEIQKEIIRTETKLGNLNPNLPGFREKAKPLIDKIEALKNKMREDKAKGGRIGFGGGSDMGTVADSKGNVGPSKGGYQGGGTGPVERPTGGGGDNNTNYDYTIPKQIAKTVAINTGKTYVKNKAIEELGLGGIFGIAPQVAAILGIINSVRNPQINEEDMQYATGGRVGLKFGSGKRFLEKVFGAEKFAEMKTRDPEMYVGLLEVVDMYRKRDKEGLKMYLQKFLPHMDDETIEAFIKGSDGTEGLVGELIRLGSGRDYQGKIEMIKRAQEMRKLDDLEVTDEMLRKPNADGGRIGLKDGMSLAQLRKLRERLLKHNDQPLTKDTSILRDLIEALDGKSPSPNYNVKEDLPKEVSARDGGIMRLGLKEGSGMTRRTFLKFLAGAASIPIIGKIFKPLKVGKTVTKVPIIKTDNVPGKPEWFDQLVNKVILEGDDVTKRFATAERQSIHQKTLDNGSVVRVTEDIDDGAVRVEYESEANVYGDPVQMQYKKPLPDEGDPRPTAEFTTAESGPVGRADGPDDYSIEIDEVGGGSIKDLDSDVSILKEYATGQKPTMREFIQNKKRKDKAKRISEGGESEMDAVINRQGEFIEADLVDLDPPDLASGGIARMLGE